MWKKTPKVWDLRNGATLSQGQCKLCKNLIEKPHVKWHQVFEKTMEHCEFGIPKSRRPEIWLNIWGFSIVMGVPPNG